MLNNIIGTLLAFVTIMLLLSLIVTSLVQLTQATLRLRGRNLLVCVGAFIHKYAPDKAVNGIQRSALRYNAHTAVAAHVLNKTDAPAIRLDQPNATGRVLLGPPISWVDPNDLARAMVQTAGDLQNHPIAANAATASLSNAALAVNGAPATPVAPTVGVPLPAAAAVAPPVAALAQAFQNMEPAISKRFQFIMRIWTVSFSFLIAFVFQLSTPELLKQLPSADAKRQAIIAAAPTLMNDSTKTVALSQDNILEPSLERLGEKFPQYKPLFEEIAGEPGSKQDMLDEMRGVLGKRADRDAVLNEYAAIIDSLSQTSANTALANTSSYLDQLDSFGIAPKLDDFHFYVVRDVAGNCHWSWSHIVGVLITGMLLSLGAPFWFQMLQNLASLRDAMNPKSAQAKP